MFVSHLYVLFLIFDFVFLSKFCLYIYLFLAELGLCCCPGFSLVAVSGGPSVAVMCKFLSVVAPGHTGFSSCSSQALGHRLNSFVPQVLLPHGMQDLSGSGIEPMSPTLAGRFLTTEPPGSPVFVFLRNYFFHVFYFCSLILGF